MSERSKEPRSWDENDEAGRILSQFREEIETLRAKVRVYRSVVEGHEDEPSQSEA
jgi:hypothetical protein